MSESALIIAPHPDDESIGCGGTALLLRSQGVGVSVLFLTSGEGASPSVPAEQVWAVREAEATAAAGLLGLESRGFLRLPDGRLGESTDGAAKAVAAAIAGLRFDRIYLPHPDEEHPDHAACLPILAAAHRQLGIGEPWLLGYEVWTPLGRFDTVEDVSDVFEKKLAAVRAHRSQIQQFAYDRAARGLNMYRGATAGHCRFAEVFASL
jgi:LmbE family N-acetylglucosaminyl deacetylase